MIINNSPDISVLAVDVIFDISNATPKIILENQSQGNNLGNVSYAFIVKSPTTTPIHEGDINDPDEVGIWTEYLMNDPWPRPFNQIEWGVYTFQVIAKDSNGTIYTHPVQSANICRPNGNLPNSKNTYGLGEVTIKTLCDQARIYFQDVTNTSYQGLSGTIGSSVLRVNYPMDDTGVVPDPFVGNYFSTAMVPITYSGKGYQFLYTSIYEYELEEDTFVRIKYLRNNTFGVYCNIDLLPLVCEFEKLSLSISQGTCTDAQEAQNKMNLIAPKMFKVFIGIAQPLTGVDVPLLIDEIIEIGGFDCNCCTAATGIVPTGSSAFDGYTFQIVPEGGDIQGTVEVNGYNIQFLLSDVKYIVKICDASPTQTTAFEFLPSVSGDGYTKTYCLSIDVTQFGYDLATAISEDPDLLSFWQALFTNNNGNWNLVVDGKCIFESGVSCDYEFTLSNIPSSSTYAILTGMKVEGSNVVLNYSFNLTNLAGLQNYLNSLGYGTFVVTNPTGQTVLISSTGNTNSLDNLNYSISTTDYIASLSKDCTGYTPISANQVVQNIINYLCGIDDSQVVTSAEYEICYINPATQLKVIETIPAGTSLTSFIQSLLLRGCNTIDYVISLSALNCSNIQSKFVPSVNAMQPNDYFMGTKVGACAPIYPVEAFLYMLTYGAYNSDIITAFCNLVTLCNGGFPCTPYTVYYVTVEDGSPADTQDLVVTFTHPDAISNTIRYARIDNTNTPVYTTIPNVLPGDSPYTISGVPDGQYRVYIKPIYSDGRACNEIPYDTPACTGVSALSASYDGTDITVTYTLSVSVPSIRITVNYPNGGSATTIYENGDPIVITPPTGVYGVFSITAQGVCNEDTSFFSPNTAPVLVTINPANNSLVQNFTSGGLNVSVNLNGVEALATTSISSATSSPFYNPDGTFTTINVVVDPASVDLVVSLITSSGTYYAVYDGVSTYVFNNIPVFNGVTINISDDSSPVSNNFVIANEFNTTDNVFVSLSGPSYVLASGSFPIYPDNSAEGLHAGFSTGIVARIFESPPGGVGSVKLYKNSVLQECFNITSGTNDYYFTPVVFTAGDLCEVKMEVGVC